MIRSVKVSIVLMASMLAVLACDKKKNPEANIRQAAKDTALQNKIFYGQCSPKVLEALVTGFATAGEASVKSAREQYDVVGANINHVTKLYSNADCSGSEAMVFSAKGTISIKDKQKSEDGGTYIDIKYDNLSAKIVDEAGATAAKSLKMCGTDNWAVNDERDVTANASEVTCYGEAFPMGVAEIYLVEGNNLYFGDRGMLQSDSDRPQKLDKDNVYTARD